MHEPTTSPRAPIAVTVSVAASAQPNANPNAATNSPYQPAQPHEYQTAGDNALVEASNCSPLIKQQNPILNQTIEHLASHDETTDLNVSFIEALNF